MSQNLYANDPWGNSNTGLWPSVLGEPPYADWSGYFNWVQDLVLCDFVVQS